MSDSWSPSDRPEPVAVVGGGLAGVTAAWALRQRGIPVRLYEAGPRVAGLAASFTDDEGFSSDFGAHFITNRLAAAIGLGAACRPVAEYEETVLIDGIARSYPLGLVRNPALLAGAIGARLHRRAAPPESVGDYFRWAYGDAVAERVAIPLVEAWSGARADQLAVSVATEKLRNGVLKSLWLTAVGRITRRAVANGYSHELPENSSVWHVYPDGGVGTLVRHLAEPLRDIIELESPVEAILLDAGRVAAVRVHGRDRPVSAVISTAPCNALPRMLEGTDALDHLTRFRFRPMLFVNLRVRGRKLLPSTVFWIPQPDFPFFRITETTRSMPWLAPPGKSMLTVDIGCETDDPLWSMDDERLTELCLDHLGRIVPDIRDRFLGSHVLRTRVAYPVFLNEYEDDRLRLRQGTGVPGLYSVGRNGEFSHSLMEDVYWRTLGQARRVGRELEGREGGKAGRR